LLQALVGASEKAAHIARLCRREEPLFQLLVAEKTGADRNKRFLQDFKTLADVLIQEVIKHDLGKEFPELQGHIHGEESNEFKNRQGETVTVRVCAAAGDTAALLLSVLDPEREAAELLAAAVHRDVELGDTELANVALSVPPQDLAIWIDPIGDGTLGCRVGGVQDPGMMGSGWLGHWGGRDPRVQGTGELGLWGAGEGVPGTPRCGLEGDRDPGGLGWLGHWGVWDLRVRVIGGQDPGVKGPLPPRRWQGRYHWGVAYGDTRLSSLSPPPLRPQTRVVLSRAEGGAVPGALGPLCGDRLRFAAGAGYKMLCVILGLAEAYVLSEGSTFAWDACGPHAILRALGGGTVALAGALRARGGGDTGNPPELVYNRPVEGAAGAERWANRGGLVAYVHPQHLEAVLAALATVPGL
ncbi:PREDICTED: inositol polyphosphate 1-phosphatase, partial [Calidris pugnax]|uniref:inositol polyphosphate 1-phosphatase n=1 Tax=Calidris pugnax TaxID=198806 RepID=UPI00071E0DCE